MIWMGLVDYMGMMFSFFCRDHVLFFFVCVNCCFELDVFLLNNFPFFGSLKGCIYLRLRHASLGETPANLGQQD